MASEKDEGSNQTSSAMPLDVLYSSEQHFPTEQLGGLTTQSRVSPSSNFDDCGLPIDGCDKICLAAVVTKSHLHLLRNMVASFHSHYPDAPAYIALVDGPWQGVWPNSKVSIIDAAELGIANFPWLALKYTPHELSTAIKPSLIRYIFRAFPERNVVCLDADVHIYAPLDPLLEPLEYADFSVTPHLTKFRPDRRHPWERKHVATVSQAGVLNAGAFAVRASNAADRFLQAWETMNTEPGAYTEWHIDDQVNFNFVTSFDVAVAVVRDPSVNVAYWNLHERRLRCVGLDDGVSFDQWTVDNGPLRLFHFSGWSPELPERLSKHASHHSPTLNPSLAYLLKHYYAAILRSGCHEYSNTPYKFGTFDNGVEIDSPIRATLKKIEVQLDTGINPWTKEGADYYCKSLMRPQLEDGSLLPALAKHLHGTVAAWSSKFPTADLDPDEFLGLFYRSGRYALLADIYRPMIPSPRCRNQLIKAVEKDRHILDGLDDPFGRDRVTLANRLKLHENASLKKEILSFRAEIPAISKIHFVRRYWSVIGNLSDRLPDPLYANSEAFTAHLSAFSKQNGLPENLGEYFSRKSNGRSLARIFSFLNSDLEISEKFKLALVGVNRVQFERFLLNQLKHSRPFDIDDIVVYQWTMDACPWQGVSLTLELDINRSAAHTSLLPSGQNTLLAAVIAESSSSAQFRQALQAYQANSPANDAAIRLGIEYRSTKNRGRSSIADVMQNRMKGSAVVSDVLDTQALNLIGYSKSPIGLGIWTQNLASVCQKAGFTLAHSVMGNSTMAPDLCEADFLHRFDFRAATNIFVSYPHLKEPLLTRYGACFTEGRQNVVYLAWEQRDVNPFWHELYDGFDHVWALSSFAAKALSAGLSRPVHTVPCSLDFDSFPAAASKREVGLDSREFCILYTFDGTSSIERKNPEAAIDAYEKAFRTTDKVRLVLKITNGARLQANLRFRSLMARVGRCPLPITLVTDAMTHADTLRLVSAVDTYLSLHRSEGFGYTCAEAMWYGKPVIATGYSGNLEFMSDHNSLLVDYEECEADISEGPFPLGSIWADPNTDHAAKLLRHTFDFREDIGNPESELGRMCAKARTDVALLLSHATIGNRVLAALGRAEQATMCGGFVALEGVPQ